MNEDSEVMEMSQYWAIAWHRRWWFGIAFGGVLIVSAALAYLLPAVYRSEATILIERQGIPPSVVETTVTGYVQEQIQQIRQRILSYDNLARVSDDFDLYPSERAVDRASVVRTIAEDIEIEMVDVKASSPDDRGERVATIAFIVAFNAPTPEAAQAVTAELANDYLEEHKAVREEKTAQVLSFLEVEADGLRAEIVELEKQLAQFKQQELRQLPELMDMNLKLYEKAEQDISDAKEQIRGLQERIDGLQSELSLTSPYKDVMSDQGQRILTASERLSYLTAEYLRVTARYSNEHPDVIRLAREIRSLASQSGTAARTDELMSELAKVQEQLRQARQKYGDDHPEVQSLERSVASIQRGFQSAIEASGGTSQALTIPPDNARYVTLKTQLDAAESGLRAERQKLADHEAKLVEYEARLFQTPVVERDYKALSRDYANAQAKYSELKNKQLEARMAQQLEAGDSGERFVLLSEPFLPDMPESPNRVGILLLGGLLAMAAGLAAVALAEYLDKTIRSARMLTQIMGSPPLAVIPQMGAALPGASWLANLGLERGPAR